MNVSFLNIFLIFLKIGAILLGGGYVIIPIMQSELVEKRKWLSEDELCDYYCVSQCLPGIIAINMSILVGYKMAKFKGVLASIIGMSFSPFVAIVIVANLLSKIINLPFIEGIFWGVNLAVIVLIYLALKEMWQKSIVDLFSAFWFLLILSLSILKVNPAILIISSIILGLIIYFIKEKKNA
ncbi:MAG: chromate transporter [Candidatus Gastranaerophilales bacterium]|nr:chromate transporter [Candidatus Gastranaerophilales bacterium]